MKNQAMKAAGGHCILCRSTRKINVHHNTYANLWNENLDDCAVLCSVCHGKFHMVDTPETVPEYEESTYIFWPIVAMADGSLLQGPEGDPA